MRTKNHNIRINVAEQSGGNTNVLESVTESIPKKLFNKLFNSKRKVLIIAPSDSVTGGGLHGKDLSKADVSVNIYAFLKAQETNKPVELCCAIGDEFIDGRPYDEIVEIARSFIKKIGGFEKFAEWGLVNV